MKSTKKHCSLLDERIKTRSIKRLVLHVLTSEQQITKDKKCVSKNSFVIYDPANSLRSLSVNDFSIQSLISVGADLHVTSLSLDNHASVDSLKASISAIDASIQSHNNSKQLNN